MADSISTMPLRQANLWDDDRRSVELNQVDADCLVLEPRKWDNVRHIIWFAFCVTIPIAWIVYALVQDIQGNAGLIAVSILLAGLLAMSAIFFLWARGPRGFHRWVRFDQRSGLMTISRRPIGFRKPLQVMRWRPLREIVSVQLLDAGVQHQNVVVGELGATGSVINRSFHLYQLNIVVDDRNEPQINLCCHGDVDWMREAGQRLARFLRVPLID
jgi:hypothetical protein